VQSHDRLFRLTLFYFRDPAGCMEVLKMNRFAIGAAFGGLAVYLCDPDLGGERRGRLSSFWRENQAGALQAGRPPKQSSPRGHWLAG
jgi:hypothetical protein